MNKKITKTAIPKMMKLSMAGLLSMSSVACQKTSFQSVTEDGASKEQVDAKKTNQCELDPVDFNLRTRVTSFELRSNTDVSFGFNLISGILKAIGAQFMLKHGDLDLAMKVTDPLDETVPLAVVEGKGSYNSGKASFKLDLAVVSLGFSHASQTPLVDLTRGGLESGFSNAIAKLATLHSEWQNKVTKVIDEDHLVLSVGTVAGLRAGDRFNVYNIENIWQGEPCKSDLLISQKLSTNPLVVAEVIQVGVTAAVLRIVSRNSAERIEPGALVEIQELKKANPKEQRALAKSVRIVSIESEPLVINNVKVNIVDYMKNQLGPIITAKGFYLHE